MEATARMKNGEPCDLLSSLSEHSEFGMSKAEMEAILEPSRYIGRCPEQVSRFLAELAPLLADVNQGKVELSI